LEVDGLRNWQYRLASYDGTTESREAPPMSAGFVTAHLDTVEPIVFDSDDEPDWKPLRHELGIGAFGVNAWVAPNVGDRAVERHDEAPKKGGTTGHEELYVVLGGAARFTVGEEQFDAPAGTLVFVSDPALTREAVATEPSTSVLAVGAARGVAFEPSEWEVRWLRKLGRL
jgi:hypothetical protein